MNTEKFTGKALAYANARPGYPLVPQNAVFADIGAGTGKFSVVLANYKNDIFAIEPNADMREHLIIALTPFPNVKVIAGTAEATLLPDNSVDAITCAQALHWFDPDAFRTECRRIGKTDIMVIAVYNITPGGNSITRSKESTEAFFKNPIVKEFSNPVTYTRDSWLQYKTSHSHDPLPSEPGYDAYISEMNAVFDRECVDGLIYLDIVTRVYSERLD